MEDKIISFLHCRECLTELPKNQAQCEYARLSIGKTLDGIQVWCERHNKHVAFFPMVWEHPQKCECAICEHNND